MTLTALPVHRMPDGYPKLAAFLDSDENFMIYRRFGYLQSQLLLEKQDDLRQLEEQLDEMGNSDTTESLNTRRDFSSKRVKLLTTIEEKWIQYCKQDRGGYPTLLVIKAYGRSSPAQLLAAARRMIEMNRPTSGEVRSIRNWVQSVAPVTSPESRFTMHSEDLVTLRPGRESLWLDSILEHLLRWCHCSFIEVGSLHFRHTYLLIHNQFLFRSQVCLPVRSFISYRRTPY